MTMRTQGGTLHVANLTEHVERLMTIAHLPSVIQIFGSEEEASAAWLQDSVRANAGPPRDHPG